MEVILTKRLIRGPYGKVESPIGEMTLQEIMTAIEQCFGLEDHRELFNKGHGLINLRDAVVILLTLEAMKHR